MRIMGLMESRDRLANAWSYTRPSGSTLRRAVVMAGWSFMRVEENLTDVYYRGRGLHTKGRGWDLYPTGSSFSGYDPTKWRMLREIFRNWTVVPEDVLLEYGSGKGRVVIWAAAQFRLRRVIGVELNEPLHTEAKANLARWKGRLLCNDITFHLGDATQFEVPDDVTLVFLSNPFTGDSFNRVLARIQASLDRQPRPLAILYYHPRMHNALAEAGFSVECRRTTIRNEWTIYQAHRRLP